MVGGAGVAQAATITTDTKGNADRMLTASDGVFRRSYMEKQLSLPTGGATDARSAVDMGDVLHRDMAVIRPFRALRPNPARVALERLVATFPSTPEAVDAAHALDPRHFGTLLTTHDDDDGVRSFAIADLVRSGVLLRDDQPSMTVLRLTDDGVERTCLFAAIRAAADAGIGEGVVPSAPWPLDVAATPAIVRFQDQRGRILRAIEAELDREPDAALVLGGSTVESWVLDDESAVARIAGLLEACPLRLDDASVPMWAAQLAQPDVDAWALACFVDNDVEIDVVPVGLCLLTLRGPLHLV
jgi:hypothetical protein